MFYYSFLRHVKKSLSSTSPKYNRKSFAYEFMFNITNKFTTKFEPKSKEANGVKT